MLSHEDFFFKNPVYFFVEIRIKWAFIYAITLVYSFLFFINLFNYFIERQLVCILSASTLC